MYSVGRLRPERATRALLIKGRRFFRLLYGVTAGPSSWAGGRALSPASSQLPVETPIQRDPAAAHEERGVVIFAGFVSTNFGELSLYWT